MNGVTITLIIPYWLLGVIVGWIPVGLVIVGAWHRSNRVTWASSWRRSPYEVILGVVLWPLVAWFGSGFGR